MRPRTRSCSSGASPNRARPGAQRLARDRARARSRRCARRHPMPGRPVRTGNRSARTHGSVTSSAKYRFGRGQVAGLGEPRQRGERDVDGAPDAGLEHAADERGRRAVDARVVHPLRLAHSTDSSRLDVDDAASTQRDRVPCDRGARHRLVERDRCRQPAWPVRVPADRIGCEWLLEALQREPIEPRRVSSRPRARTNRWRRPRA